MVVVASDDQGCRREQLGQRAGFISSKVSQGNPYLFVDPCIAGSLLAVSFHIIELGRHFSGHAATNVDLRWFAANTLTAVVVPGFGPFFLSQPDHWWLSYRPGTFPTYTLSRLP